MQPQNKNIRVRDIKTDSRKIQKGDLFIAYNGEKSDHHDFIPDAIENGASVVVGERVLKNELSVPYYQVKDGRRFWAECCAQKYDNPQKKLKIIGVTGTDGKTTTCNFIYEILKNAGKKSW